MYIDSFPRRNRKDVSQEYAERMLEKMQNEMGDLPLTHFTPDTLLNWINASKNRRGLVNKCNPKNTSLRTKYNMLGIVRAFFTFCRKQGYISRNPCSGVVLPPLPASNGNQLPVLIVPEHEVVYVLRHSSLVGEQKLVLPSTVPLHPRAHTCDIASGIEAIVR